MNLPSDSTESPDVLRTPEVPPLPGPPSSSAKRSFTIIPAWAALLVLALLLLFVLSRNFQVDRTSVEQDVSDFTEKMEKAVQDTKLAFSETFSLNGMHYVPTVSRPSSTPPKPEGKTAKRKGKSIPQFVRFNSPEDEAIKQWRELANSKSSSPGVWRRLGITLFLFDRPGGMEAFRHIADAPKTEPQKARSKGRTHREQSAAIILNPPGEQPQDEVAIWEAIYGPNPLKAEEVAVIRAKLDHLNLGWFQNIAVAQLYDKAGMRGLADRSAGEARASADRMSQILASHFLLLIVGTLTLIAYGLVKLVNMSQPSRPVYAAPYSNYTVLPSAENFYAPPGVMRPAPLVPYYPPTPVSAKPAAETASPFSYRVRMIAFVVYFGTFIVIGWPLKFVSPLITRWSDEAVLRLETVLSLLLYLPVVAITLIVFKRLAEAENKRRLTWRETLAAMGIRTDGFSRDGMTAIVGYAITFPLIVVAGVVSSVVFKNFHTPVHPVDVITMLTQNNLDRFLLLLEASVAAPIVEELMFRGLLFQGLKIRWGVWGGAALSAAVFALSHNTLPGGFLTLWTLGFSFALVYQRNNSIVPNILMHAIHNGLVTVTMFTIFSQ